MQTHGVAPEDDLLDERFLRFAIDLQCRHALSDDRAFLLFELFGRLLQVFLSLENVTEC